MRGSGWFNIAVAAGDIMNVLWVGGTFVERYGEDSGGLDIWVKQPEDQITHLSAHPESHRTGGKSSPVTCREAAGCFRDLGLCSAETYDSSFRRWSRKEELNILQQQLFSTNLSPPGD